MAKIARSSTTRVSAARPRNARAPVTSEPERLEALYRYQLSESEPRLDRLTRLAAGRLGVPFAQVNFITEKQLYTKSSVGLDVGGPLPREQTFCHHAIRTSEPLVIEDTRCSERFRSHPLVEGAPHIRFYAGAPLQTPGGYRIGTLCVMGPEPRTLDSQECQALDDLSATAMDVLVQQHGAQQRELVETKLQRSERRHRRLVERGSELIAVLRSDATFKYLNAAFERVLGWSPTFEDDALRAIHPDDRRRVYDTIREVAQEPGSVHTVEYRYRHADGSYVHLESVGRNLLDDPAIEGIVVNSRDITARVKAEERRRRIEERFRLITETVTQVFWIASPGRQHVHYISPAFEEMWGRPRAAFYEDVGTWIEAIHPDDRERVEETTLSTAAPGARDEEFRIVRPDGEVRWVHDRSFLAQGEGSEDDYLIGVQEDVTERRKAEKRLAASEARFRSVIENARDVVFRTDADGRWTLLSPSWKEVMGYSIEESLGQRFTDYMHPSDRPASVESYRSEITDADGISENERRRYQTKSGETRWLRVRARLLRNEAGDITGATGTLTDVTDSIEVQAERVARLRAEELLEAKTSFLNNMSHELRTPLASIIGFSQVLSEDQIEEDVRQEFAERIGKSGARLQRTLESVLKLAQFEGEHAVDLDLEPLDVREAVREAAEAHRSVAEAKGLSFRVEKPEAADDSAERLDAPLDAGALGRVLDNLLSNAIKFTEEGGVRVGVETGAEDVRIAVADTGIGIGGDFQERIFEDFSQESTGLARTHEGAGLGLAIARRLTEKMDGTLEVESKRGEGSVFTARFPRVATASDAEEPASDDAPAPPQANGASETPQKAVLIVEDNANTRALAEHILRSRYYVESTAGEQALELMQQNRFDLLLMDINLGPEEGGVELLQRLRNVPGTEQVPAVAFTAHATPGDEERFRSAGFEGYLAKPFSRNNLLDVTRKAIDAPRGA